MATKKETTLKEDTILQTQPIQEEINMNRNITVMNGTIGTLVIHSSFSNRTWNVLGFGKKFLMTLSDLLDVSNDQPVIFESGWAVIMDQQAIDYLNYTELYKNIIKPSEMEHFLQMPENKIREILKDSPEGVKQTVAKIIKQKIEARDPITDSSSRIKMFEELLNVKFE